jgi:hypothetical protein
MRSKTVTSSDIDLELLLHRREDVQHPETVHAGQFIEECVRRQGPIRTKAACRRRISISLSSLSRR